MSASVITSFLALAVMGLLLIFGIILIAVNRRHHGRAATLGIVGCVLLLLGLLINIGQGMAMPTLVKTFGISSLSAVAAISSIIFLIFQAGGIGLLIWAVVIRRDPPRQAPPQPTDWQQQPQPGWPQQPQQQPYQQPGWQTPPQPPFSGGQGY
jgi:membrane-bound ClpP family serine protease